jgi:hypothetical protein
MVSIKKLKKFDKGWEFDVDGVPHRTNSNGEGLWVWAPTTSCNVWNDKDGNKRCETVYEYKQILGTSQFSLAGYKNVRSKLYREFRDEFPDW